MYELKVEGMTCNGCVKSVTKALNHIDPKANVTISLEKKSVQIESTSPLIDFINAIKKAGFEVIQ